MQTQTNRATLPDILKQIIKQKSLHHKSTKTQTAVSWRKENSYTGKGGVVVLFQGKVQGWVNELRDPQSWQSGCIAIDENGNEWIATGGNNYGGAKNWEKASRDTLQDELKPIKQSVIINPVKRKPVPVRSLADKLADPNTLTLPFTKAEVSELMEQYAIYEHLNDVCFPDFGAFISHIVAEQLQGANHA